MLQIKPLCISNNIIGYGEKKNVFNLDLNMASVEEDLTKNRSAFHNLGAATTNALGFQAGMRNRKKLLI